MESRNMNSYRHYNVKQNKKTKKIKKKDKQKMELLWSSLEQSENDTNINDKEIECIYEKDNVLETNVCKECKSSLYVGDEGFLFCSNKACGILYKDIVDFGAEWRYHGADDNNHSDPTRCGMPINPLLVESSYGCKIMCGRSSSYEMRKIKRYTEWQSMPYKEKSKYDDFQIITLIAKNSGIPKIIIDDAIRYYDKISEAKTFRGLNRDGLLAASIYISFSINRNPRTSREIASIFHLDNTSATKGCKNAVNILNDLELSGEQEEVILTKTTPCSFIGRYCSKLNINQELTKLCLFIANIVEKNKLIPENTPHSIAAGIIYFVSISCNLSINKKDINNVSQISEVTINKCYKKLEKYEEKILPKTIIKKYGT